MGSFLDRLVGWEEKEVDDLLGHNSKVRGILLAEEHRGLDALELLRHVLQRRLGSS